MSFGIFQSPISLAHHYWTLLVKPGDLLIDATCGNGHDTLFLAHLKPRLLYGFDIQKEAIHATHRRLGERDDIRLIQDCHSRFPAEISPQSVSLIVYNLGYLPGADK